MKRKELASFFENRVYDMDVRYSNVTNVCYEAKEFGFASVQVFPTMLCLCTDIIKGTDIQLCAMLSYPCGGLTPELKVFEAQDAVQKGATTLMIVMNGREFLSGNYDYVRDELGAVKKAVGKKIVKVIIETENLKEDKIADACKLAMEAGLDGIVTSTGLYNTLDENRNDVPIKTTAEEIRLIKSVVGDKLFIEAQGNISTLEHALLLIEAGTDMIGSRFAAKICTEL